MNETELKLQGDVVEALDIDSEIEKIADNDTSQIEIDSVAMVEEFKQAREKAVELGNDKLVANIDGLLRDLDGVNSLDIIGGKVNMEVTERLYSTVFKKARQKLSNNKRHMFMDIKDLETGLTAKLGEGYSYKIRVFLYKFYRFISEKPIHANAIVIGQLIINLHKVIKGTVPDEFKETFISKLDELA